MVTEVIFSTSSSFSQTCMAAPGNATSRECCSTFLPHFYSAVYGHLATCLGVRFSKSFMLTTYRTHVVKQVRAHWLAYCTCSHVQAQYWCPQKHNASYSCARYSRRIRTDSFCQLREDLEHGNNYGRTCNSVTWTLEQAEKL